MRGKIFIKIRRGLKTKIKVRLLLTVPVLVLTMCATRIGDSMSRVMAAGCPDVRFVFARGSGGARWEDQNYLAFKSAIEAKIASTGISYEFIDLDYPAVGVGVDNLSTTIGAAVGAGEAYEFGASVKTGSRNLINLVNGAGCPSTKYVLGGYSQGAMVVSRSLSSLKSDRVIYAATFGDPKLYLPEGKGLMPAACKGQNLSDYRAYVPDCRAYKGLLGAYIPYEPDAFAGKVGTWCNKRDIFCSSHLNITDHVSYVTENLYEDASRVIYNKVCDFYSIAERNASPHDTAILIDSTGSMSGIIDNYKSEALSLAKKTWAAGGRVALYDYRDYQEGYKAVQRCSFETCNEATFATGLASITASAGGDIDESLLASSLQVMQELNWKVGSTKSIVVLTDAGYHDPDFDAGRTTRLDVVALSKKIDPVSFYIITTAENVSLYADLAAETGGRVVTTVDDLSELTEYIMARYDSLPQVEESDEAVELPVLTVESVEGAGSSEATVHFSTSGASRVLVALNDAVLGVTEESSFTLTGLDLASANTLTLVPLGDDARGEAVEVVLNEALNDSGLGALGIPKVPDTGKF